MRSHHRLVTALVVIAGIVALVVLAAQASGSDLTTASTSPFKAPPSTSPVVTAGPSVIRPIFDYDTWWVTDQAERQAALDALTAQQAQELADRLQAAVQHSLAVVPAPVAAPAPSGNFAAFRDCTIAIESHGQYDINTGNGYYGAWQFLQSTWDSNAAAMGRPDLVGQVPSSVSPADQDAVAAFLYSQQGNTPWGGRC